MIKFPTNNKKLKDWINAVARLCQPDDIVWIDGSDAQRRQLEKEAIELGEVIQLNQEKLPGCYLHRTAVDDVARTEHLTFICTKKKHDAGSNNNWMPPSIAYKKAKEIFRGAMKGRVMYVIPFSMGPMGSPFSKIGVELTDSRYVVLNMIIMTRAGEAALRQLEKDDEFTKCLHSKAGLDINKRLILHFPEDNTNSLICGVSIKISASPALPLYPRLRHFIQPLPRKNLYFFDLSRFNFKLAIIPSFMAYSSLQ